MSASLVGSEMCIRDSARSVALAATRTDSLRRAPKPSRGEGRLARWAGSCLLYTSDAADDM
eukprot:9411534-Alexandrium_andersonii.AAC.1